MDIFIRNRTELDEDEQVKATREVKRVKLSETISKRNREKVERKTK